jgi:hypothetical protein
MLRETPNLVNVLMLHQIYYHPDQLPKILPFSKPYFNSSLTIFFENKPIQEVVSQATSKNVGVCSWKLVEKMKIRTGLRRPLTQDVIDSDYEVLSFTQNSKRHQMIAMGNTWHKGFIPALDLLWQKLGFKRPGEAKHPIYQNHFAARTDIYQDYVKNFLTPAMELILTDEELNKMMLQPSGYGKLNRKADMTNVRKDLNMDDYPLCPFILERCACLWFQMKGIKISYL